MTTTEKREWIESKIGKGILDDLDDDGRIAEFFDTLVVGAFDDSRDVLLHFGEVLDEQGFGAFEILFIRDRDGDRGDGKGIGEVDQGTDLAVGDDFHVAAGVHDFG